MTDYPISMDTDLIAVLGSSSLPDGTASPAQMRRCQKALELWKTTPGAVILLLGGAVANDVVESETMGAWLLGRGVPESQILKEGETANTRSQALFLAQLAHRYHPRSLSVVSDLSHLTRIKMLLHHAGMDRNSFGLAGSPEPTATKYRIRSLLYETLNYGKDWVRTSLGIW